MVYVLWFAFYRHGGGTSAISYAKGISLMLRRSRIKSAMTIKTRDSLPRFRVLRVNQKTKGLILNEEKKTILSRPERNLSVFRGEWLLMTVLTWAQSSVKSRCGRTKDCKSTTKCLSGEKTKLSVNWILLSKSSQQHLALSWTAS